MIKQLIGDSREILKTLEPESIQCCVTSPPYWGLRDYGHGGQIGLEGTYQEYIDNLVLVFNEVKRVLRNDGTLWVNIADSYAAGGGKSHDQSFQRQINKTQNHPDNPSKAGLRANMGKSLIGIPERFVIAMTEAKWIRRNTIIWHKPNCMPESVKDRFTNDFEYLYFFTKSKNYYFKQQLEPQKQVSLRRAFSKNNPENRKGDNNGSEPYTIKHKNQSKYHEKLMQSIIDGEPLERNKRCVWEVPTKSYRGGHFAVFPHELIKPCILAGSREGNTVLDPFAGSGTTGEVALRYNREAILIELNPDYVKLQDKRTAATQTYFDI